MLRGCPKTGVLTESNCFNGHPPLGVNATVISMQNYGEKLLSFNGHPPLGVNATETRVVVSHDNYYRFNGHPPLGVNATVRRNHRRRTVPYVSMGTHPWG